MPRELKPFQVFIYPVFHLRVAQPIEAVDAVDAVTRFYDETTIDFYALGAAMAQASGLQIEYAEMSAGFLVDLLSGNPDDPYEDSIYLESIQNTMYHHTLNLLKVLDGDIVGEDRNNVIKQAREAVRLVA